MYICGGKKKPLKNNLAIKKKKKSRMHYNFVFQWIKRIFEEYEAVKLSDKFGKLKKIIAYLKLINRDYSEMKKAPEPWNL